MAKRNPSKGPTAVAGKPPVDAVKIGDELEVAINLIASVIQEIRAGAERWAGPEPVYLAALEKAGALADRARGELLGGPPDVIGTLEIWADETFKRRSSRAGVSHG